MRTWFDVPKLLILIGTFFGVISIFQKELIGLATVCLIGGMAGAALKYDDIIK